MPSTVDIQTSAVVMATVWLGTSAPKPTPPTADSVVAATPPRRTRPMPPACAPTSTPCAESHQGDEYVMPEEAETPVHPQ